MSLALYLIGVVLISTTPESRGWRIANHVAGGFALFFSGLLVGFETMKS